jgi:hypothetical protein
VDFFEPFLRTRTTLQSNAISAQEIISPFVDLTSNLEDTHGFTHTNSRPVMPIGPVVVQGALESETRRKLISPFPKFINLLPTTKTLGRPCGHACPAIPRLSTKISGIGHWKWGEIDHFEWEEDLNLIAMRDTSTVLQIVQIQL